MVVSLALAGIISRAEVLIAGYATLYRFSDAGQFQQRTNSYTESLGAITVGPDGNIYELGNGVGSWSVLVLDQQGKTFLGELVPPPMIGIYPNAPFGLDFSTNGTILVGCTTNVSGGKVGVIREFDRTTGVYLRDLRRNTVALASARGLSVGPDGNVYVAMSTGVTRFDYPGGGASGFFAGTGLTFPHFSPDGKLHVWKGSKILRFDGTSGEALGEFIDAAAYGNAYYARFGPDGFYYLLGSQKPWQLNRFDGKTGTYLGVVLTVEDSVGSTFGPEGFVFTGPRIATKISGTGITLSYPNTLGLFVLEKRSGINSADGWQAVTMPPSTNGLDLVLTNSVLDPSLYYRLRLQ